MMDHGAHGVCGHCMTRGGCVWQPEPTFQPAADATLERCKCCGGLSFLQHDGFRHCEIGMDVLTAIQAARDAAHEAAPEPEPTP